MRRVESWKHFSRARRVVGASEMVGSCGKSCRGNRQFIERFSRVSCVEIVTGIVIVKSMAVGGSALVGASVSLDKKSCRRVRT